MSHLDDLTHTIAQDGVTPQAGERLEALARETSPEHERLLELALGPTAQPEFEALCQAHHRSSPGEGWTALVGAVLDQRWPDAAQHAPEHCGSWALMRRLKARRTCEFIRHVRSLDAWRVRDLTLTYDDYLDNINHEPWYELRALERLRDLDTFRLFDAHDGLLRWMIEGGQITGVTTLEMRSSLDHFSKVRDDTPAILSELGALPHLRRLLLDQTHIGDEGARRFAPALLGQLQELSMRDAKLTEAGVAALADRIPEGAGLEVLRLSGPDVQGDAAIATIAARCALRELDVSSSRYRGDSLGEVVAASPRLERLAIGWSWVTPSHRSALNHAPALRDLDISFMNLEEGLEEMIDFGHPTLERLTMRQCEMYDESLPELDALISRLPALTHLDITANGFSRDALQNFKNSTSLEVTCS